MAQDCGIQALAIHGRTRSCMFKGEAEYDTIATIKEAVSIPIIANGDVNSVEKAKWVLEKTRADAIMIGRGAQGKPWIFREILHYLATGEKLASPTVTEIHDIMINHMHNLYAFYGESRGILIARKHVSWYSKGQRQGGAFRHAFNQIDNASDQLKAAEDFFGNLMELTDE